ncbi:MAG: DNA polymerase III subunit delta' [Clostridium sp.]|uniref:DNA polymerase III subunit delta' n=1 Tax=Clostridium sp. TaxID=1506 RepID=UPI00305D8C83
MIGHDKVQNSLIQAIDNNKLSHAHIIVGEKGIGKSELVKIIALKILGINEIRDHVDIIYWTLDKGKTSISVNTIRGIINECNKKPFEGDKKVIIIDNGDKITFQAQNAFLKTIEEPPSNVFIFILCEDLEGILDTIKSRCCVHKLKPLNDEDMKIFLKKKYSNIEDDKLKIVSAFAKGIPGRAEKLIDSSEFSIIRDTIFEIISKSKDVHSEVALHYEKFFSDYGNKDEDILDIIITVIRDIIIYKEVGDESFFINIDKSSDIKDLANIFSSSKLNDMIKIVDETRNILKNNVNASLAYITMILKMQEV